MTLENLSGSVNVGLLRSFKGLYFKPLFSHHHRFSIFEFLVTVVFYDKRAEVDNKARENEMQGKPELIILKIIQPFFS